MNYIDKSISGLADSGENINESGQSVSTDSPAGIMPFGLSDPVLQSRNILTNVPLTGGGSLEDDLSLGLNASSTAIANYVILRDANGRARVAAPSSASDIARKAEVDAVEERLDTVEFKIPVLSDAVNNASSLTGASSRAVKTAYDKAVSAENNSVPLIRNITTTAPLNGGGELNTDLALSINASSAATPNSVIQRDANGRAKVAAPSVASDIARKGDVDAVEERLDTVESRIPTLSDAVNSTSSTVAASSKAVKTAYDKAVAAEANSIPSSRTISTAAPLTGGGDLSTDRTFGINASSAATANYVIQRDANGRAKVAAPAAADDIARKADVDAMGAATTPLTRIINTTMPLTGGGDLSGDRTLGLNASSNIVANYVIQRDDNGRAQVVSPLVDNDIATKSYVDTMIANAIQSTVLAPKILAPTEGAVDVSLNLVVQISPFAVQGGTDTAAGLRVQIARDNAFSDIVHDSGWVGYSTLYSVPVGLEPDTQYYVRAAHKGVTLGEGPWSTAVSFKTAVAVFAPRFSRFNEFMQLNAVTATPGGGCIAVGMRLDGSGAPLLKLGANLLVTKQIQFSTITQLVDIKTTSDGGYIAVGYGVVNSVVAQVVKLDANLVVTKQVQLSPDCVLTSVIVTPDGGYIAVGYYRKSADTPRYAQIFKLDANLAVTKQIQFSAVSELDSITETPGGDYIAVGYGIIGGYNHGLVVKLDANLTLTKQIRISDVAFLCAVTATMDGGCIAVGLKSGSGAPIFKLDANLVVTKQIQLSNPYSNLRAVTATPDGGYILTGDMNSYGLVVKLNSSLAITKQIQCSTFNYLVAVTITTDGSYLIAGFQSNKYGMLMLLREEDLVARTVPCAPDVILSNPGLSVSNITLATSNPALTSSIPSLTVSESALSTSNPGLTQITCEL